MAPMTAAAEGVLKQHVADGKKIMESLSEYLGDPTKPLPCADPKRAHLHEWALLWIVQDRMGTLESDRRIESNLARVEAKEISLLGWLSTMARAQWIKAAAVIIVLLGNIVFVMAQTAIARETANTTKAEVRSIQSELLATMKALQVAVKEE